MEEVTHLILLEDTEENGFYLQAGHMYEVTIETEDYYEIWFIDDYNAPIISVKFPKDEAGETYLEVNKNDDLLQ